MLQPAEPSWFYSSLAQVTAAIVGFLGGFIILRLLGFMSEWRETADGIRTTGAAWNAKRKELDRAEGDPNTTPAIESEIDRLWGELVRLLTRRDAARFPRVVSLLTLGMLLMTAVGSPGRCLSSMGRAISNSWPSSFHGCSSCCSPPLPSLWRPAVRSAC